MKNYRFTGNTSKYDCAPVAITNAAKYFGWRGSYRKIKKHFDFLYDYENAGVNLNTLTRYLMSAKDLPFKVHAFHTHMRLSIIKQALKLNKPVIVSIPKETMYHTCFVIGLQDNYAIIVNWHSKSTITKVKLDVLKKYLKYFNVGYILEANEKIPNKALSKRRTRARISLGN